MAYTFNPFTGNFDNTGSGLSVTLGQNYDSITIDRSNPVKEIFIYKLDSVVVRTVEVTFVDATKEELLSIEAV